MNQMNRQNYGRGSDRFASGNVQRSAGIHQKLTEENYVELAERAIDELIEAGRRENRRGDAKVVTTSKLRNLLAMTANIYNEVVSQSEESISRDAVGRINYLKVRFLYDSGRTDLVKSFVETADILRHLDDIKESRRQFILFSRYMEALVAFRKYKIKGDE